MYRMASYSLLLVVVLQSVCAGCASPRMTADGRQAKNVALRTMAHNTRTPTEGDVYIHKGGRTMLVIQSLEDGVLVHPVVGETEFEFRGMAAVDEKMTIYIETPRKYVDNEYLKAGLYEYVGSYVYTGVHDVRKTVRKFREVKEALE